MAASAMAPSIALRFPCQIKGLPIQRAAETEARDVAKRIQMRTHFGNGLLRLACQENADDPEHFQPQPLSMAPTFLLVQ